MLEKEELGGCLWQQHMLRLSLAALDSPVELVSRVFPSRFRYHCPTLPPVSRRAVETVTLSKVLWTGTQVPSCQRTNCRVFGTPLTPTEGNTATTTRLRTPNKVCGHRVRDAVNKDASSAARCWNETIIEIDLGIPMSGGRRSENQRLRESV